MEDITGQAIPASLDIEWSSWREVFPERKIDDLEETSGVYRVTHSKTSGIIYVGYSDNLLRRIQRIPQKVSLDEEPAKEPHIAAPIFWNISKEKDCKFMVSWAEIDKSNKELEGVKAAYIAAYRANTGLSPSANFSYEWSGENQKNRHKTDWTNWKKVKSDNWLGFDWKKKNLNEFGSDVLRSKKGIYRVWRKGSANLRLVGANKNLRKLVRDPENDIGRKDVISFAEVDFSPAERREIVNDLMGAHYFSKRVAPENRDEISKLKKNALRAKEGQSIDFKAAPPLDNNKKEFALVVAAMANAEGGKIFVGVRQTEEGDNKIDGLKSYQEAEERLNQLLRDNIEPNLPLGFIHIEVRGEDVLVIEVPDVGTPRKVDEDYKIRRGSVKKYMDGSDFKDLIESER